MLTRSLRALSAPLLFLLYWQILAGAGLVPSYLLPAPSAVLRSGLAMWAEGVLQVHVLASLARVAQGFLLSAVLGCLAAGLLSRFRLLAQVLDPPLGFLRMTPPLALIPLLILWLGIGGTTQVTIIVLASFFPVFLNVRDGLTRLDDEQRELARSLRLARLDYIRYFALPAALPSIVTGWRLGFGYSWRALIGAELISASSGLGYLVLDAQQMQRTDEVMVGILIIGVLGWFLDAVFQMCVRRVLGRRFPEVTR